MFDALIQRAAAAAEARAGAQRRRIAERLRAELPGVAVTEEADAVAVSGRALGARLVLDPEFRRCLEER